MHIKSGIFLRLSTISNDDNTIAWPSPVATGSFIAQFFIQFTMMQT